MLLTGKPSDAIAALEGQVWRKQVDKAEVAGYEAGHVVLSKRLVAGQPVLHVFSADRPEAGFEPVAPDLEDVYFQRLRLHARQAA